MARKALDKPTLTPGNKLYLYRLLSGSLGRGKQTFLPRVQEALEAERLGAADLGYEDTRALLEDLAEFMELKVFKGGRVYATVTPLPEWDAALETAQAEPAPDATKARGNKPWKRKKGQKGAKALKPSCPRRVKREEEAVEDVASDAALAPAEAVEAPKPEETIAGVTTSPDAAPKRIEQAGTDDKAASEDAALRNASVFTLAEEQVEGTAAAEEAAAAEADDAPAPAAPEAPGIALTVTYDPYTGREGDTVLTAELPERGADAGEEPARHEDTAAAVPVADDTPASVTEDGEAQTSPASPQEDAGAPAPRSAPAPEAPSISFTITYDPETGPAPAPREAARPAAPAPADAALPDTPPSELALKAYPRDFHHEVHVPSDLLGRLARIVPLHADALEGLTADFRTARGAGTVRGTRAQASFPLRHAAADGSPLVAHIAKNPRRTDGAAWVLAEIAGADDAALATAGLEGLPLAEKSASERAIEALGDHAYLPAHALEALAARAFPHVWDAASLRTHLALTYASGPGIRDGALQTGLFTQEGDPLVARFEATDDDIPYRLV